MRKTRNLTILFLLVASASFAQRFSALLKETPGAVSYTFRDALAKDVPGTLDRIKAMGITNMEFSGLFGQTPEALRALLDARGIRCTSLGVGYGDMKKPENVIKTAKTLGAQFVRIASIPHKDKIDGPIMQQAVADFNAFGKILAENGLTFCYHNHGPEFEPAGDLLPGSTLFDYLVEKTNPKYVSFEMDILWVFVPGYDPVAYLKKYPERFKLMHLKDRAKGSSENVPMGQGQINIHELLRAVQKSSVKFLYIEDESKKSEEQVPVSLAYMKQLSK
ncbi:sugar phosphate isomerase/epimerase family protein [Hufsiella ginkgonis]|uniref:TIM barrel protein n=1 Tax=Hufsiella ginkgonis TaxID=2695274 RepID=A0A7K1Y316_9SPHI|nr:sugar phosphate isomerase/epimerase [Hufsiella ginkgonis]MXV17660.1 TIM barrel protein [Hufsiella ginkgonis]